MGSCFTYGYPVYQRTAQNQNRLEVNSQLKVKPVEMSSPSVDLSLFVTSSISENLTSMTKLLILNGILYNKLAHVCSVNDDYLL